MKPRLAIRDVLLLGGIGFGLLALVLLVTPGWLHPAGAPDLGPPEPTAPAPASTVAYVPTPPAPEKPPPDAATPLPGLPTRLPGPLLTTIPPLVAYPYSPPAHAVQSFCTPTAPPLTPDPQATPWPTAVGDASGRRDFGAWGYTYSYGRAWGDLFAAVYYDDSSVAGLAAYVQANRDLAGQFAQLGGDESFSPSRGLARVDLTFRGYVPPEQARAWVQAHHLLTDYAVLRVYDPQGLRLDFTVSTSDVNDPIPTWYIDRELNPPGAPACGPFTLSGGGVYFVTALADPTQLPVLAADPLVYLADVTPNVVRRDLWQQYQETRTDSFQWVHVQNGSPFWQMEDLGLEHFR
jgi:hypothetical protein